MQYLIGLFKVEIIRTPNTFSRNFAACFSYLISCWSDLQGQGQYVILSSTEWLLFTGGVGNVPGQNRSHVRGGRNVQGCEE